jgi:lipopolysaccharide exporter
MTSSGLHEIQPAESIVAATEPGKLSLGKRVRAGLSWILSSALLGEVIRLVRSVVLARILLPEDFGLFGMALTIAAALNALTTIGLSQTVVSYKFESDSELKAHLDTAWSAELVRSLLVALLLAASAFPMARFYGQRELIVIVPVLALTSFISGFQNIGLTILRKQLSFAKIFWYELATNLTGFVLTVGLAVVMRSVWALVLGLFLTAVIGTTLSYIFHSYRPRFAFEKTALRRAVYLGKFTLVIAVAAYVMNMADNVMVGRFLGTSALGNYSLAFNISSAPISVLIVALSTVLFPAYAEITAENRERLERAFLKVFELAALLLMLTTVPLFLLADQLVLVLFGNRWAAAAPVLRILALIIPLRGLAQIISTVFVATNRPKQMTIGRVLEATVFLAALYPLLRTLGLTGAAWAGLIAYAVAGVNRVVAVNRLIPGISSRLLRISMATIAAAAIGLMLASFCLRLVSSPLSQLAIGGAISTLVPAAILLLFRTDLRKWMIEWVSF